MRPNTSVLWFGWTVVLALVAPSATLANDWPVPCGPSREPVPYGHDLKLLKQVPRDFLEDAPACILYFGTTHLIEPDGTVETIAHEVTRLNSRKGIDKLGEYRSISYAPAYQKLTLNVARVLKPNGTVVPIQPKHVHLRDLATDYQVYDPEKQLIISFPNLEIGDIIEVRWTTRGKNPEYHGHFFTRYSFGDDRHPTMRDELRVRLPKNKPLRMTPVNGAIETQVKDDGDHRLYTWTATRRPALPQDSDLPSKEDLRLQLACSTFASWAEVGRWKKTLRADCWQCTPAIRKVVQEVTQNLKTPQEKAAALTYWVRRRIRYVSAGVGHAYTPHQPAQVLANLFGDCKDQAQLLAVMLRELGLLVWLVTLGALDDGQVLPEVPMPWGTHGILLTQIDGQAHWIDTTATNAPWNFLPLNDRNRIAYLTHEDQIKLMRTPALTRQENRLEQVTDVTILPDGTVHAKRTQTFFGLAALYQRNRWLEASPGERRRGVVNGLQDAYPKTKLRVLFVNEKDLQRHDGPVRAHIEFEIPRHFSGEPEREGNFSDSSVWSRILAYTLDYERTAPLELDPPYESLHRYHIDLPAAFRLDGVPRERTIRSKWGVFQVRVKHNQKTPRRLQLEFSLRMEGMRVAPADFAEFRKFHEDVNKVWRVWLTLTPTRTPADAPELLTRVFFTPGDRITATVLARLYLDQEEPENARQVLRWVRLVYPDDATLWELTVKSAANLAEEEAAYRVMVRRFPKQTKYALALGTVCVQRGNHAGARTVLEPLTRAADLGVRAAALVQLARSAAQLGQHQQALAFLGYAEKADADTVAVLGVLQFKADVQERLGKLDDARTTYRQALKLDGQATDVLQALVRLELQAKRHAEALSYLRRYTVLVGDDVTGLVQAADWYLQMDRFDEAFDLAQRARAQKFHPQAQRILGLIYLEWGNVTKALFHLERAECDAVVLDGLLRSHLALGQLGQAVTAADKVNTLTVVSEPLKQTRALVVALGQRRTALLAALKPPPQKASACGNAVDALVCAERAYQDGRPVAQVETLLRAAFATGIEVGPAFGLRGLLALEHGKLTAALADAERALALGGMDARALYVRGRIRLERGDGDALGDLTRAAALTERKEALTLHWLAAAEFQAGKRAQALLTQRRAVELRPEDGELRQQLEELERAVRFSSRPGLKCLR